MIDKHLQTPFSPLAGRLFFTLKNFVKKNDFIDKNILDIGCGFGWFENWAINIGVKKITATEINKSKLKTVGLLKNSRLNLRVAKADKLPFEKNSFDTVVSWEVIEHIPAGQEDLMLSEIRRVLKPNGILYLSTPFNQIVSNLLDPAWWLIGHRHYSLSRLQELAHVNGFRIKKYCVRGKLWEIVTVLNLYIAKWIFDRHVFFSDFFTSQVNKEYRKSSGYAILFIKLQKDK